MVFHSLTAAWQLKHACGGKGLYLLFAIEFILARKCWKKTRKVGG